MDHQREVVRSKRYRCSRHVLGILRKLTTTCPSVSEELGTVKPSFIIFKPNPSPVRHYTRRKRSFGYYRQPE